MYCRTWTYTDRLTCALLLPHTYACPGRSILQYTSQKVIQCIEQPSLKCNFGGITKTLQNNLAILHMEAIMCIPQSWHLPCIQRACLYTSYSYICDQWLNINNYILAGNVMQTVKLLHRYVVYNIFQANSLQHIIIRGCLILESNPCRNVDIVDLLQGTDVSGCPHVQSKIILLHCSHYLLQQ